MPDIHELPVDCIDPSPHNPRMFHEKDPALASLAASVSELGVLQPVLVRKPDPAVYRYELLAGERRWRASKLAGLETLPALVRDGLTDAEAIALTVTENLQREDLHPLEEAAGVASLVNSGTDYRTVAQQLGRSLGWVARRARLAQISPAWRDAVADPESDVHEWSAAHLELVARLAVPAQDEILEKVNWRLTVEELQRLLADYTREIKKFPWKVEDATLVPEAGSCAECAKTSACHPGLFDAEIDGEGAQSMNRCLDATCYAKKMSRYVLRRARALEEKNERVVFVTDGSWQADREVPAFAQGKLTPRWELTKTKKTTKGALPVLVVSGPNRGSMFYATFDERASAGGARKAKPETAAEKLVARKAALDGRRKAAAITAFVADLEGGEIPAPAAASVHRLAAAFGTRHTASSTYTYVDDKLAKVMPKGVMQKGGAYLDPFKAYTTIRTPTMAAAVLWGSVRLVLSERLTFYDNSQAVKLWPDVQKLAKLLGVDAKPYLAAAAKDLPEPKSWAKLRAAAKEEKATP